MYDVWAEQDMMPSPFEEAFLPQEAPLFEQQEAVQVEFWREAETPLGENLDPPLGLEWRVLDDPFVQFAGLATSAHVIAPQIALADPMTTPDVMPPEYVPPAYDLPEVVVTGDREGSFWWFNGGPPPHVPSGELGGGYYESQATNSAGNGQDPVQQCGADGKAREAADLFFQKAAEEGQHIAYRERGAYILRNDDGTYRLSGYAEGVPMAGSVAPDPAGITPGNIVGMIHNHPGGTLSPSGDDKTIIQAYQNYINSNGGTQEFRMYIVASDGKIYVYDVDNMNDDVSTLEVSGGCK